MDQIRSYKANGIDPESGRASTLEFADSDAADAIGCAVRAFGPGQFLVSCEDGRNWRIHVAGDHSWWLEPASRL